MSVSDLSLNINLLSTISILMGASTLLLGFFVYLNDKKNVINKAFFSITVFTIIWIISVLVALSISNVDIILFFRRLALGSATWIAFSIYYFSYYFPKPNKRYKFPFIPLGISALLISLASIFTPYVLKGVNYFGGQQQNDYSFGYYIFAAFFISSLLCAIYNFVSKSSDLDREEKAQTNLVLIGIVVSGAVAITTNLILPRIMGVYTTGQFGPLAIAVFVGLTTFALIKHHLFSMKIIAIELLTSVMWLVVLIIFLFASTLRDRMMDGGLLAIAIIVGGILTNSVSKELKQRENFERLDRELEASNNKLKILDSARKEFLSFVSHQLRTPMTVIKGYASYLKEENFLNSPDKVKDISNKITNSVDRMNSLIGDLLDARALEEGKMTYVFEPIDFVKLVSSVYEELKSSGMAKKLELSFDASDPVIQVSADQIKLRQAVQNLIDNAIKYTNSGFVKVVIKTENKFVIFSVSDSGYGLSDQVKDNLFQEFVRDKAIVNKVQGLGLGLYITKEIIKAHGGGISAESEGEGKGSIFTIKLKQFGP
jgi:signal transduction histidine kinase